MNERPHCEDADVVIVGAGLAGLTAARELTTADYSVIVLEARSRVGGRTLSQDLDTGETVDLGGQWIGSNHDHIRNLITEFDLETIMEEDEGDAQLRVNDKSFRDEEPFDGLPAESLSEIKRALEQIENFCEQIPLNAPYSAPKAKKWDAITVESWKQDVLKTADARSAFSTFVRAQLAVEPSDLSLLSFLYDIHAAGGLNQITEVGGSAPEYRIVGGAQQLSQLLANEIDESIHLGTPVQEINQGEGRVSVVSNERRYTGSYAIIAIPLTLAGRLTYDPPLPARRDALTQRMPMGSAIKFIARYDEPFWRDEGYSGMVLDDDGVVGLVFDDTSPKQTSGALVGFILGNQARTWSERNNNERYDRVLTDLSRYFGSQAANPVEYVEQVWTNEPWSAGCYAGVTTPGTLSGYGDVLRKPVGRIHWAGTETATKHNGYMEGAIRSGKRVAHDVIDQYSH